MLCTGGNAPNAFSVNRAYWLFALASQGPLPHEWGKVTNNLFLFEPLWHIRIIWFCSLRSMIQYIKNKTKQKRIFWSWLGFERINTKAVIYIFPYGMRFAPSDPDRTGCKTTSYLVTVAALICLQCERPAALVWGQARKIFASGIIRTFPIVCRTRTAGGSVSEASRGVHWWCWDIHQIDKVLGP